MYDEGEVVRSPSARESAPRFSAVESSLRSSTFSRDRPALRRAERRRGDAWDGTARRYDMIPSRACSASTASPTTRWRTAASCAPAAGSSSRQQTSAFVEAKNGSNTACRCTVNGGAPTRASCGIPDEYRRLEYGTALRTRCVPIARRVSKEAPAPPPPSAAHRLQQRRAGCGGARRGEGCAAAGAAARSRTDRRPNEAGHGAHTAAVAVTRARLASMTR